jgi:hypothetical protein
MLVGISRGSRSRSASRTRVVSIRFGHRLLGNTKISKASATTRVKQHIAGLQVTMNYAALMGVLEGLRDFEKHWNDFEETARTKAAQIAARG